MSIIQWRSGSQQLGVTLPPRLIETNQNLENFFRTHGRTAPPEPLGIYALRLQAEALRLSRGFDQLICLDELAVEHYEHQMDAALRALRDMRGRALAGGRSGAGQDHRGRHHHEGADHIAGWCARCWCSRRPRSPNSGARNCRTSSAKSSP
jgi:hypothetical protein